MTDNADAIEFPYRLDDLDGFSTDSGPTFDGGSLVGGGPRRHRLLTLRTLTPHDGQATVEVDLTDGKHHGCSVSLPPDKARQAAAALLAAAAKCEAEIQRWQGVLDGLRTQLMEAQLRDAEARAGVPAEGRTP